ncbi:MAG: hypothetical protein HW405_85 [Candidatus Berkelbacteria bacterium]|nr:hypothetical protein [Candidatus Berkelbacteria bacterium]
MDLNARILDVAAAVVRTCRTEEPGVPTPIISNLPQKVADHLGWPVSDAEAGLDALSQALPDVLPPGTGAHRKVVISKVPTDLLTVINERIKGDPGSERARRDDSVPKPDHPAKAGAVARTQRSAADVLPALRAIATQHTRGSESVVDLKGLSLEVAQHFGLTTNGAGSALLNKVKNRFPDVWAMQGTRGTARYFIDLGHLTNAEKEVSGKTDPDAGDGDEAPKRRTPAKRGGPHKKAAPVKKAAKKKVPTEKKTPKKRRVPRVKPAPEITADALRLSIAARILAGDDSSTDELDQAHTLLEQYLANKEQDIVAFVTECLIEGNDTLAVAVAKIRPDLFAASE